MGQSETLRAAALIVAAAILVGAFAMMGRRSDQTAVSTTSAPAAIDDLAVELRRCGTLGPGDAPDARCQAVWEENRRRFFGGPSHPVVASPAPAASTPPQDAGVTP